MDETPNVPEVQEPAVPEEKYVVSNYLPTPMEMVANPMYNTVGKILGLNTQREWNTQYDKVHSVVQWAMVETQKTDPDYIIMWLKDKVRQVPSVSGKRIDDFHLYAKLHKQRYG